MVLPAELKVLRHSGFRLLAAGQAVSAFGDWMGTVALMALVLELTGSAAAVGGILVLRLLPAGVAAPLAGRVAVRWDRRHIMLATDLARAGIVALIPFVRAVWWVYLWAFLLEVASLVFLPARDAAIPDLVEQDELPSANGVVLVSSYGNIPLGAAGFALVQSLVPEGGGFLATHPAAVPLWVDAATFLVSFALIWRLTGLGPAAGPVEAGGGSGLAAFRDALRLPVVRAVLPGMIPAFLGIGALFSVGIVYVQQVLGATAVEFGFLVALFGAGGAAGWLVVQHLRDGVSLRTIRAGLVGMGAVLTLMGLVPALAAAYALAVPFGLAAAAALIAGLSYLQERLDEERRVLGLAAFHLLLRVGLSAGAIAAGAAAAGAEPVRAPLLGTREPAALVLLAAGLLLLLETVLLPTDDPSPPA